MEKGINVMEYTNFDRKDEYNRDIIPKIAEIKGLCIKYNIPFIMAFATENSENGTNYSMDGLMPGIQDIHLKDNKLKDVFAMLSGYVSAGSIDYSALDDDYPEEIS